MADDTGPSASSPPEEPQNPSSSATLGDRAATSPSTSSPPDEPQNPSGSVPRRDRASSSVASSPPPEVPHQRQVVDLDPDDNDWVDEDVQLEGLGTTTHRSRNRTVPVIPVRKHRRVPGANARATADARAKKSGKRESLATDLAAWEE
ncbi:hypothetical protein DFH09DRAFT_1301324 [Mycena vulgaris]|nr:hypothetical protein DFH09DRAFT_1301324 [Mycena vulgaris]